MGIDPVAPNPENIHSFNRYAYANNNPYKFVDPDGRNPELLFSSCPTCFFTGFDNPETAYSSRADALGVNLNTAEEKRQPADNMFDEARALTTFIPQGEGVLLSAGLILKLKSSAATFGQIKTALVSAQEAYKGNTVVGHALSKHAGRNPQIWGTITGSMKTWNDQGMKHFRDIARGPGDFQKVTTNGLSFMEKRLSDGRGIRLNMDYTFKGFTD